ncbi:hypothetical protein AKJ65_01030 [candidate division MSBL1 archaeon SCGC-AAA259E19]|uniref:Orotate phosphoribosyltransferase n=1 Tax=candidate division MSBL1 archaeon SCGC-AAA259E19 TaxID=1698264 RepID=A0A133UNA9_9EURY|nr:hypothetical protein AKJ65_01030 [candidate division MSBL1 archaeon SCGC-AAA259E19]
MNEKTRRDISLQLYRIEAIKFGKFTLTSGKSSPFYVDLRIVPSYPKLFEKITNLGTQIAKKEIGNIDQIAGVPTGGLPYATAISQNLSLPLIYVRKEAKSHGRKKAIEGKLRKENALIVDDTTTTGGSVKSAGESVKEEGATVENALVMVDREEGARENLREIDIKLHTCFTIHEILEYLNEYSDLSEKKYSRAMDYLEKKS